MISISSGKTYDTSY